MSEPIPVIVIGGYLGAGKTTLVNHLLRESAGRRIAVLVNDFGELPIDADLIESSDGNTIAIAGGCVCCSFGSDLMAALMELAARSPQPDHVLIEASGVALPGAVAASVTLLAKYAIEGVVVLADAENVRAQAADRYLADTIERQLGAADLVVLNKADLVTPAIREELRTWLETKAPLIESERARIPRDVLLGFGARSAKPSALLMTAMQAHPSYESLAFDQLPALDAARLAAALAGPVLGVIRAKGIVRDLGGETSVLHVVGRRAEVITSSAHCANRLVCIGLRGRFDREAIGRIVESFSREPVT